VDAFETRIAAKDFQSSKQRRRRLTAAHRDADRLSVETFSGGLVIISGTVSSWAAHDHAVAAAWSAAGVTDVDDRLGVEYSP
jgi:osmotically-inducible protein OsmY